jgi:hypothetical protein
MLSPLPSLAAVAGDEIDALGILRAVASAWQALGIDP